MLIKPLAYLTLKKIRENLGFRINTIALFIQPLLWLTIFIFLRQTKIIIDMELGPVKYVDFLVIGIFTWRMVTFMIGYFPKSVQDERPVIRALLLAPSGESIIFWSSIFSTAFIAILIGIVIMLAGAIIYNVSIFLNNILIVLFVLLLIIIVHLGFAIIFFSFSIYIKDAKSIGFILTTIFGLFSGVFFPPQFFPVPMNQIAFILPMTQGITLLRDLTLYPNAMLNWNLLYALVVEAIIFFSYGRLLYKKKLRNFIKSK